MAGEWCAKRGRSERRLVQALLAIVPRKIDLVSFHQQSRWSTNIQVTSSFASHQRGQLGNAAQVDMADEEQPDHPVFKQVRQPRATAAPLCPHWPTVSTPQATVKELLRLSHEPNTRSESCCFRLRFTSLDLSQPHSDPSLSSTVSAAATHLSAEYLRLFATEAIHRAAEVAEKEREASKEAGKAGPPGMLEVSRSVSTERAGSNLTLFPYLQTKHLEQILAGVLLDFS